MNIFTRCIVDKLYNISLMGFQTLSLNKISHYVSLHQEDIVLFQFIHRTM